MTLLKAKSFHDSEARVLRHLEGSGRHKGRLGALFVETADGAAFSVRTGFSVPTGFSDAERENPPALGSFITFCYQELTEGGVPRFSSYVGVRADGSPSSAGKKGERTMKSISTTATPTTTSGARRFEFAEGGSSKFWAVSARGKELTIR